MNDKNIKVLVIGSISDSTFIKTDVLLLKEFFTVDTIDIIGGFNGGGIEKTAQLLRLSYQMIFEGIPKIWGNDIIYIWFADIHAAFCISVAKVLGKKTITIIGGYEVCNMPEINYGLQRGLRGLFARFSLKFTDRCIVPSQSYYNRSLKYISKEKLVLLSTCTRLKYPDEFTAKDPSVLMIGNATKDSYLLKGIPLYNKIASEIGRCFLIGSYDDEIKNKYDKIWYCGKLSHEQVIEFMSHTKVYCQLSYTESYGISVMESMACGCIPVVTDKDNLKDIVKGNKFAVHSNDENEIISGIKNIMKNAKEEDCVDMFKLAKMKINYACAERKFGLSTVVKGLVK